MSIDEKCNHVYKSDLTLLYSGERVSFAEQDTFRGKER